MNRRAAILFAIVIAAAFAGAWLSATKQPAPGPAAQATEACDDAHTGQSCSVELPTGTQADASSPAPGLPAAGTAPERGASAAPAPPAPDAATAARLREEAHALIRSGRMDEGVAMMRRAVEANPTAEAHGELGAILEKLTDFTRALVELRAAAELDPDNADRWIALARTYYRAVNPGQAWQALRRAKEVEPDLELARDAEGLPVRRDDSARATP